MLTSSRIATAPMYAVLPATDIQRARDFWERVAGLEVAEEPMEGSFFVKAGQGTKFMVYETQAASAEATVASFVVEDLDSAMNELRERGVRFEDYDMPNLKTKGGVVDMGTQGRAAWFKDSEGNTINLAEMTR